MTGQIIGNKNPPKHQCSIVFEQFMTPPARIGDIWECDECHRWWIAYDHPRNRAAAGQRTVNAVIWRREGALKRWLRKQNLI